MVDVKKTATRGKTLTPQQKREIMFAAECSPRTVDRWLNGPDSMKPTTRARLDRAWAKMKEGKS